MAFALSFDRQKWPAFVFMCLSIKPAYGEIKAWGGTHLTAIRLWLRSPFRCLRHSYEIQFEKTKVFALETKAV